MKNSKNITVGLILVAMILVVGGVIGIGVLNVADGWSSTSKPRSAVVSADSLIGKPAPSLILKDVNGTVHSLESLRGRNVILFFNEGLRCYPACWNAMVALGKDPQFNNADTAAFSVVVDAPEEWRSAMSKVPELKNVVALFDPDGATSNTFGMLSVSSSMHVGSLPGHTYMIIDRDGIIRYVLDDPQMGVRNNELVSKLSTLSGNVPL